MSALSESAIREFAELSASGTTRVRACESRSFGRHFCVFIADGNVGRATSRFRWLAMVTAIVRCARES